MPLRPLVFLGGRFLSTLWPHKARTTIATHQAQLLACANNCVCFALTFNRLFSYFSPAYVTFPTEISISLHWRLEPLVGEKTGMEIIPSVHKALLSY